MDLVHSSGILGHHFHADSAAEVLDEVERVLKRDGLAVLDSGPTLRTEDLVSMMKARGFLCCRKLKSWALDRNRHLAFKRNSPDA